MNRGALPFILPPASFGSSPIGRHNDLARGTISARPVAFRAAFFGAAFLLSAPRGNAPLQGQRANWSRLKVKMVMRPRRDLQMKTYIAVITSNTEVNIQKRAAALSRYTHAAGDVNMASRYRFLAHPYDGGSKNMKFKFTLFR